MNVSPNINTYWIVATSVFTWLIFFHSPQLFQSTKVQDNPVFGTHLVLAYILYGVCIVNALCTPLNGSRVHSVVGKVGMLAGYASFCVGLYLAWWPGRSGELPPLAFSIPITSIGIFQLVFQYLGVSSIREFKANQRKKKAGALLQNHIFYMVALLSVCCVAPSGILFFVTLGWDDGFGLVFLVACIASVRPLAHKLVPSK